MHCRQCKQTEYFLKEVSTDIYSYLVLSFLENLPSISPSFGEEALKGRRGMGGRTDQFAQHPWWPGSDEAVTQGLEGAVPPGPSVVDFTV